MTRALRARIKLAAEEVERLREIIGDAATLPRRLKERFGLVNGLGLEYARAGGIFEAAYSSLMYQLNGIIEAAGVEPEPVCCNVGNCQPDLTDEELAGLAESTDDNTVEI